MKKETEPKVVEKHAQDFRWKIKEDGIFQTLSSSMGTGGGNVPLVMIRRKASESENSNE